MNYNETIAHLYAQLPVFQQVGGSAYKEGLDNSLALDKYFHYPHHKYRTIHVAGTNGKGSTSHLLAAVLQQAGYKVGLYTSPHLVDFRERIRVDGHKIDEQYVVDFVAQHTDFYESIQPSFFELTMTMAFLYFAHCRVDVAIIETGLGGRLDSTNIIAPDLCIITNISYDHIQFLGNTLEKIASEKAGIIKPHTPVVIGEMGDEKDVFARKAKEVDAPILFAEEIRPVTQAQYLDGMLDIQADSYPNLKGQLAGYAQTKNANTVLTAIGELIRIGYNIPHEAVYQGFAHVVELTGLLGRWQELSTSPKIVCDTGHNVAGIEYIVDQLANETYTHLHIVIGVVNDKDVSGVLCLLPRHATYYFTRAAIPRSLPETDLQKLGATLGLHGNAYPTVAQAVDAAKEAATTSDFIFVGGSNFVVGDYLSVIAEREETRYT